MAIKRQLSITVSLSPYDFDAIRNAIALARKQLKADYEIAGDAGASNDAKAEILRAGHRLDHLERIFQGEV